ncbi:putative ATPase/DNA-binding CsgD family transcriptional regulator [Nocardia transvalensis]|uniref:Putative ATPase/DNA-binding CsgD family transcriptional regulator n=1 Tax=Nocardia transvalensis TaxID=37333 RepID=A0A7W9PH47_9NOCA|nr:LuxR C-terminal-related transcriptional regulator [Nocardia transvalensis]MBB5916042.1 putative ATPase/DNA-binding CsgD family transcriptional regulator [Nocardia transvalensis]
MARGDLDAHPTSYIGRAAETAEVRRLLGAASLVTLTGTGGIGKTRLARRTAAAVAGAYRDGTVFVELAEARHDTEVPQAVADRLQLRLRSVEPVTARVLEHLRDKNILLVLDNCEHLLDGCAAFAAAVLDTCRDVVILATSRQSLGVPGEHVFRLPPLAAPVNADTTLAELSRYEAVRLFTDRAAAVRSDFALTDRNARDVARLCHMVDGVPLAIELAAARMRSLSPQQVLARWSGGLGLSTSWGRTVAARHQNLRATIDWSYGLCTGGEQVVWARLSVFASWFDLDAAEFVCAGGDVDPGPVVDVIDALVDKSILERHGDQVVRFRLLQPLRDYGRQQLDDSGEHARVLRRHRDWFHRMLTTADAEWFSPHQAEWVSRLQHARADVRAAIAWSLDEPGHAGTALSMAARVEEFWTLSGANREVRAWLERALAATPEHPLRARAWAVAALHSLWLTDLDTAARQLDRAEAAAIEDADPALIAYVTGVRAHEAKIRLDNDRAAKLAGDALEVPRAHGRLREAQLSVLVLGLAGAAGDPDGTLRMLRDAVTVCERCGDSYYREMMLFAVALIEVYLGNLDTATQAATTALRSAQVRDSRFADAYLIEALAWAAAVAQDHLRAATLFGAADAAWELLGAEPAVVLALPHGRFRSHSEHALGDRRFAEMFATGRALPVAAARGYALGDQTSGPAPVDADPLTGRELEVAALVAQGLTNRDIAARLVIAPRTADTHVRNILTKLGFAGRAQIGAWITARSPT